MKVHELISEHGKQISLIRDLENALLELRRCNNWELCIEKDERPSVKMLWGALKNHREKLKAFMALDVPSLTVSEDA